MHGMVLCVLHSQPWEWEDEITQESLQMWTSHFEIVNILFIVDTTTIDGYKINVLNQIKQLDSNRFHMTMLDLSCRSGNPISEKPFLQLLIENEMQHYMVEACLHYSADLVKDTTVEESFADVAHHFLASFITLEEVLSLSLVLAFDMCGSPFLTPPPPLSIVSMLYP